MKEKINLTDFFKDKKARTKVKLIFYCGFFLIIVIFARLMSKDNYKDIDQNNSAFANSFISKIEDNYEYDMVIEINDDIYEYYGKMLGYNGTINLKTYDEVKSYRLIGNKYYVSYNDNYVLVDAHEVYPYIDYRYLNINSIRDYMELSYFEDGLYKVNISDIVLNSNSYDYLEIYVNEGDKNIVIDYTPLLKLFDENMEKVVVSISYYNIDNVISLEE